MDIKKVIKDAVKDKRVIIGYNRVMREIKTKKPRMVVTANNIPRNRLENIIYNAKIAKVEVFEYPDDSLNLGLICGKPFTVSVLAIKGSEK
ncbi:MAG: 50S ribosomal protein L30e [Candidatus Aenigmatarchaeota archaeon]